MQELRVSDDTKPAVALYQKVLDCWNRRAADDYAALLAEAGNLVAFDGSQINGRGEVAAHLWEIFAHHVTPTYVGKIKDVRLLTPEVAILRAVAGLIPPGQSDVVPALNAVQTLVAAKKEGTWRVELYQNTPAAFHGRPDLSEQLTAELRAVLPGL